jgi:hypothetical protein
LNNIADANLEVAGVGIRNILIAPDQGMYQRWSTCVRACAHVYILIYNL